MVCGYADHTHCIVFTYVRVRVGVPRCGTNVAYRTVQPRHTPAAETEQETVASATAIQKTNAHSLVPDTQVNASIPAVLAAVATLVSCLRPDLGFGKRKSKYTKKQLDPPHIRHL